MTTVVRDTPELSGDKPANLLLFERMYILLLPWIIAHARCLSSGDRDLQDDLMQTGLQTVWELCEPGVTTLHLDVVRERAYLAMVEYRRAERRAGIVTPDWICERDEHECELCEVVRASSDHTVYLETARAARPRPSGTTSTSYGLGSTSRADRRTSRARRAVSVGTRARSSTHRSTPAARCTSMSGSRSTTSGRCTSTSGNRSTTNGRESL